jgi:hypothetical protein
MSDAVNNGPARDQREDGAHRGQDPALAEAKAKKAHDQAAEYRRKAKGDGPLAKYRRLQAEGMDTVADQRRHEAGQLRTKLAKAKADEAPGVKHVKRTVASTAAEGLVPKAAAQPGPEGGLKPRRRLARVGGPRRARWPSPTSRPSQANPRWPARPPNRKEPQP